MFVKNVQACINAGVPAVAVQTPEWERCAAQIQCITQSYACWSHVRGLVKDEQVLAEPVNPLAPFVAIEEMEDTIVVFINFNIAMKHPTVIQRVRDVIPYCKANGVTLVFLSVSGEISAELEKEILVLDYDLPDRKAIQSVINGLGDYAEGKSDGYDQMVEAATGLIMSEAENYIALALAKNGLVLNEKAVEDVKRQKATALKKSGVLELYEPDNLPKVGGLDQLKIWLWERGKAFSPEAREFGLPFPKGILVFGVPGTGKSLIAKTIARQWNMQLLMMGNVLDKYVGESEKKMKEALKIAERMAPCVLMIDEVEKFFAGIGGSSDSGVSTRIFGLFLSWMQETKAPVFVVATANNIAGLPPELLRKGRFDELWFVDLPGDFERQEIISIHLKQNKRDDSEFDLPMLAKQTSGYTGSEIEQVVLAGMFRAFSRGKDIDTETLLEAAKETAPLSVTMAEQIAQMREWGKTRARLASTPDAVAPESKLNAFVINRKLKGI